MKVKTKYACGMLAFVIGCILLMQPMAIPVSATINPTAAGMTEFALKAMVNGWGFIYGTSGQIITQSLIDSKARQYPDIFAEIRSDGQTTYQYAKKWIGQRAVDCVGLTKAYLWWRDDVLGPGYSSSTDRSANGLYYASTVRGPIGTLPETHGLILWREGHVGVYVGNGEVIESRGVEYGVVKTHVTDREWIAWFRHPDLSYNSNGWTKIGGRTFYYRNGIYLTGLQAIDGLTYYFGQDGARQDGFLIIGGKTMYFRPDGALTSGWLTLDGSTYFMDAGGVVQTGWQDIGGGHYLFSSKGILLTGWQEDQQITYYLDGQGQPVTGLVEIGGRALNFGSDGRLLTGWQQTAAGWTYLNRSGLNLTGLQIISGKTFWLDGSGIRKSGWQAFDGKQGYFDPEDGAAVTGCLRVIDSLPRLFNADGSLVQTGGFQYMNGCVYLTGEDGQPLTGSRTVTAWPAPVESGMDPVPTSAALLFSDDYSLAMANQDTFTLSSASLTLSGLQDPANASGSLGVAGQIPEETGQWLSLDPAVAAVSSDGTVTSAGPGRTLVLYLTGSGDYAACQVAVLPDPATIHAETPELTLEPDLSVRLAISGLADNLYTCCQFASSDPEIVSVSPDGVATAHREGTALISLSYGNVKIAEWTLTAVQPCVGLSADRPAISLPVGGLATGWVHPVPAAAGSAGIAFSSSNPAVARISTNGDVRGISAGTAVITAQLGDFKLSCNVVVSGAFQTLRTGSSGELIRQLQDRLAGLGYWVGKSDGCFGYMTEFAVSCFQEKQKLPVTGQADSSTLSALFGEQAAVADPVKSAGLLQSGDAGASVSILQRRLYELNYLKKKPDGQFDSMTMAAVRTLQVINGLSQQNYTDAALVSKLYSRTVKAGKSTLQKGDAGYEVQILQTRLKELGYFTGSLDGQYSAAVETAVVAFQLKAALSADGIAGPLTQQRLFSADAPAGEPGAFLAVGSKGAAVLVLERRLIFLGYHYALADSSYDDMTAGSIKAFQRRAGLSQTGRADTVTLARLASDTAPRSTATYRAGSSGENVRRIQIRLNLSGCYCGTPDGRFGYRTDRAVRAFQNKYGLKVDGIVGSRVAAKLFYTPAVSENVSDTPAQQDPPANQSTLGPGSSGTAVQALEARLVALGYHCALADTTYDALTAISVKAFQRRAGLSQTGQADTTTQSRLESSTAPRSSVIYLIGSSGENVKRIQARLNQLGFSCGTADGRFGSRTDYAVHAFQRKAGLVSDGYAGSRTLAALFSPSAPRAN
jgi:peptidoglycan hydrolase-like protein with peptidoglycan-binding domain/glucan-binding YG repeat protein